MKTAFIEQTGIQYPIAAFTHCRDVLIAVCRAGGLGVLGTARLTPEQVEIELRRIDEALGPDKIPYGVDILYPAENTPEPPPAEELQAHIPEAHRKFVASLVKRFKIPAPNEAHAGGTHGDGLVITPARAREMSDVVLRHPIKVLAAALGPPPADIIERAHAHGVVIGGLVGSVGHARRHVEAGVDFIIAEGSEAGGHTGEVATMVLVPDIVDAVSPTPVLAAGGIGCGRQAAAALALGAAGVWTGSIWLTTAESDDDPVVKQKLLKATSRDTIRSRCASGKPVRQLRTPWVEAWESKESPGTLSTPYQGLLVRDALAGIYQHKVTEVIGTPVGQIVGRMNAIRPAREVLLEMVEEMIDSSLRLNESVLDGE